MRKIRSTFLTFDIFSLSEALMLKQQFMCDASTAGLFVPFSSHSDEVPVRSECVRALCLKCMLLFVYGSDALCAVR